MATGVPAMLTAGLPARGSEVSEPTELTAGNEGTVLTYLERDTCYFCQNSTLHTHSPLPQNPLEKLNKSRGN